MILADAWLEITMACNLRCSFCYNQFQAGAEEMQSAFVSAETVNRFLDHLQNIFEIRDVTLAGGEPIANPQFREIISVLNNRGLRVILATNGTLLKAELVKELIAFGVSTFQVSVLGGTAADHDAVTRLPGSFMKTIAGAVEVRRHGGELVLVCVEGAGRPSSLMAIMEIAYLLGVRIIIVNEEREEAGAASAHGNDQILNRKRLFVDRLLLAASRANEFGIELHVPTFVPDSLIQIAANAGAAIKFKFNKSSRPLIVVDPLGRIRPCQGSSEFMGTTDSITPEQYDPLNQK